MFDKNEMSILKIFSVVFLFIVGQWIYISKTGAEDPLNKLIFRLPIKFDEHCCSSWPISHFILYGILAYMYPSKWKFIFIIGVLWEIFEYFMFLLTRGGNFHITRTNEGTQYDKSWWNSSRSDIVFNGAGILLALLIRRITSKV